LHRAPSGDYHQFLRGLDAILKSIWKSKIWFLNLWWHKYRLSQWKQLKETNSLLTTCNLTHTVNFATRIQNDSSTAIDNIFVDSIRFSPSSTSPIICGVSDHDAQYLMINNIVAAGNLYLWSRKQEK
jgi:hypothetical protein